MEKKPQKVVLIINGEPIDVCAASLALSGIKAKKTLNLMKQQSRENVHSFRFFWTDVIMLNIMTNQLLQSIDTATLKRIVKPVASLDDDLEEYRRDHKRKVERLQDALVKANDKNLPLDYSRELEKYFKTNEVENLNENNDDTTEDAKKENSVNLDVLEDNKTESNHNTGSGSEDITTEKKVSKSDFKQVSQTKIDDDETPVSFFDAPNVDKEIFSIPNNSKNIDLNDFDKNVSSFTQSGEIDINSLFDEE